MLMGDGAGRRPSSQDTHDDALVLDLARRQKVDLKAMVRLAPKVATKPRWMWQFGKEFKATGNSELVLDRNLAEARIFPAINIEKSATRKEELLVDQGTLTKMWVLRRILMQMGTIDAMQFLLDKMKDAKSNEDFFASMNQ